MQSRIQGRGRGSQGGRPPPGDSDPVTQLARAGLRLQLTGEQAAPQPPGHARTASPVQPPLLGQDS